MPGVTPIPNIPPYYSIPADALSILGAKNTGKEPLTPGGKILDLKGGLFDGREISPAAVKILGSSNSELHNARIIGDPRYNIVSVFNSDKVILDNISVIGSNPSGPMCRYGVEAYQSDDLTVNNFQCDLPGGYGLYAHEVKRLTIDGFKVGIGPWDETDIRIMDKFYGLTLKRLQLRTRGLNGSATKLTALRIHGDGSDVYGEDIDIAGQWTIGPMMKDDGGQRLGYPVKGYWLTPEGRIDKGPVINGVPQGLDLAEAMQLYPPECIAATYLQRKQKVSAQLINAEFHHVHVLGGFTISPGIKKMKVFDSEFRGTQMYSFDNRGRIIKTLNVGGYPFTEIGLMYPEAAYQISSGPNKDPQRGFPEIEFIRCKFYSYNGKLSSLCYGSNGPLTLKFTECQYDNRPYNRK